MTRPAAEHMSATTNLPRSNLENPVAPDLAHRPVRVGVIGVGRFGENHVRADCLGTRLILTVNGRKMTEIEDFTFSAGKVGFAVGTGPIPGHEVIFTYFAVYLMER